jgi:hypothetical protein
VAVLAGRRFADIEQFPIDRYREPLERAYLVVDNHLTHYFPDRVEQLLARTEHETVIESGPCALHRLLRVLPYRPIPQPAGELELAESWLPEQRPYPFSGGLEPLPPFGRSHAVSGFILDNNLKQCLAVDLWVSPRAGRRPRFEVFVDQHVLLDLRLVAAEASRHVVALDGAIRPIDTPRLVELWMYRDTLPEPYALWYDDTDMYVVKEVGFVDCPPAGVVSDAGAR